MRNRLLESQTIWHKAGLPCPNIIYFQKTVVDTMFKGPDESIKPALSQLPGSIFSFNCLQPLTNQPTLTTVIASKYVTTCSGITKAVCMCKINWVT